MKTSSPKSAKGILDTYNSKVKTNEENTGNTEPTTQTETTETSAPRISTAAPKSTSTGYSAQGIAAGLAAISRSANPTGPTKLNLAPVSTTKVEPVKDLPYSTEGINASRRAMGLSADVFTPKSANTIDTNTQRPSAVNMPYSGGSVRPQLVNDTPQFAPDGSIIGDNRKPFEATIFAGAAQGVEDLLLAPKAIRSGIDSISVNNLKKRREAVIKRIGELERGYETSPYADTELKSLRSELQNIETRLQTQTEKLKASTQAFEQAKSDLENSNEFVRAVVDYNNETVDEMTQLSSSENLGERVGGFLGQLAFSGGRLLPSMAVSGAASAASGAILGATAGTASGASLATNVLGRSTMTAVEVAEAASKIGAAAGLSSMFGEVYSNTLDTVLKSDSYKNGSVDEALAHKKAFLSAVTEVGTEILVGGVPGFGEGLLNPIVSRTSKAMETRGVNKLISVIQAGGDLNSAGATAAKVFAAIGNFMASKPGEIAFDILGEGVEEMLSEIIEPYADRISIDPNSPNATASQVLLAGLSGALLGGVFQMGNIMQLHTQRGGDISSRMTSDGNITADFTSPESTGATVDLGKVEPEVVKASVGSTGTMTQEQATKIVNDTLNSGTPDQKGTFLSTMLINKYLYTSALNESDINSLKESGLVIDGMNFSDWRIPYALRPTEPLVWTPQTTYADIQNYIDTVAKPTQQRYTAFQETVNKTNTAPSETNPKGYLKLLGGNDGVSEAMNFDMFVSRVAAKKNRKANSFTPEERKILAGQFTNAIASANAKVDTFIKDRADALAKVGIKMKVVDRDSAILKKDPGFIASYNQKTKTFTVNRDRVQSDAVFKLNLVHELGETALRSKKSKELHMEIQQMMKSYGVDYNAWLAQIKAAAAQPQSPYAEYNEEELEREVDARFLSVMLNNVDVLSIVAKSNPQTIKGLNEFVRAAMAEAQRPTTEDAQPAVEPEDNPTVMAAQKTSAALESALNGTLTEKADAAVESVMDTVPISAPVETAFKAINLNKPLSGKAYKEFYKLATRTIIPAAKSAITERNLNFSLSEALNNPIFIQMLAQSKVDYVKTAEGGVIPGDISSTAVLDTSRLSSEKELIAMFDRVDERKGKAVYDKTGKRRHVNPKLLPGAYITPAQAREYITRIMDRNEVIRTSNLAKSLTGDDVTLVMFPPMIAKKGKNAGKPMFKDVAIQVEYGFAGKNGKPRVGYALVVPPKNGTETTRADKYYSGKDLNSEELDVLKALGFTKTAVGRANYDAPEGYRAGNDYVWFKSAKAGEAQTDFWNAAKAGNVDAFMNAAEYESNRKDRYNYIKSLPSYPYRPTVDVEGGEIDDRIGLRMSFYDNGRGGELVILKPDGVRASSDEWKTVKSALRARGFKADKELGTSRVVWHQPYSEDLFRSSTPDFKTAEELNALNGANVFTEKPDKEITITNRARTTHARGYLKDNKAFYEDGTEAAVGEYITDGDFSYAYGRYEGDVFSREQLDSDLSLAAIQQILASDYSSDITIKFKNSDDVVETGFADLQDYYADYTALASGEYDLEEDEYDIRNVEYILDNKTGTMLYENNAFSPYAVSRIASGDTESAIVDAINAEFAQAASESEDEYYSYDELEDLARQSEGSRVKGLPVFSPKTDIAALDSARAFYDTSSGRMMLKLTEESQKLLDMEEDELAQLIAAQGRSNRANKAAMRDISKAKQILSQAGFKKLGGNLGLYGARMDAYTWGNTLGLPSDWAGMPDVSTIEEDAAKYDLERDIRAGRRDTTGRPTGGEVKTYQATREMLDALKTKYVEPVDMTPAKPKRNSKRKAVAPAVEEVFTPKVEQSTVVPRNEIVESAPSFATFDDQLNPVPSEIADQLVDSVGGRDGGGSLRVFDFVLTDAKSATPKVVVGKWGKGIYAKAHNAEVMENSVPGSMTTGYLNITNPIVTGVYGTTLLEGDTNSFRQAMYRVASKMKLGDDVVIRMPQTAGDYVADLIRSAAEDIAGPRSAEFARNLALELGYDGIVTADGAVAFFPEQVLGLGMDSGSDTTYFSDSDFDAFVLEFDRLSSAAGPSAFTPEQQQAWNEESGIKNEETKPAEKSAGMETSTLIERSADTETNPEFVAKEYMQAIEENSLGLYAVQADAPAVARAEAELNEYPNIAAAYNDWKKLNDKGEAFSTSKDKKLKDKIVYAITLRAALEQQLVEEYNAGRDYSALMDAHMNLTEALAEAETEFGQAIQAAHLFNALSPQFQTKFMQNIVKQMSEDVGRPITINKAMLEAYQLATDPEVRPEKLKIIADHVAAQLPKGFLEWQKNWRYLAMLANPVTHVANVASNTLNFLFNVVPKAVIGGAFEDAFTRKSNERTKTLKGMLKPDRAILEFANSELSKPQVMDRLTAQGKYLEAINKNPQAAEFKRLVQQAYDPFLFKSTKKLSDINTKALETEDVWALRWNYRLAFRQYCAANGYTIEDITADTKDGHRKLEAARQYAVKQAQEATYRNLNAVAAALNASEKALTSMPNSKVGKKAMRLAVDVGSSIIPFKNVPANFLARGVEYSPIGLVKTAVEAIGRAREINLNRVDDSVKVDIPASEVIDSFAKNLTGTAAFLLGAFLTHLGLLKAGGSDDDREEYYDQTKGRQKYSLTIPGVGSVAIDRIMPPTSIALFMGSTVETLRQKAVEDGETNISFAQSINALGQAFSKMADPIVEMSFLDGLDNLISATKQEGIKAIPSSVVTNYVNQFFPTIGSKVEGLVDPTVGSTYAPSDADTYFPGGKAAEQAFRKIENKAWGLGGLLGKFEATEELVNAPSVDLWGRPRENTIAQNLITGFLMPTYFAEDKTTQVDDALSEIFKETKDSTVYPTSPAKTYTFNGEKVVLTNREYSEVSQVEGQASYDTVDEAISSPMFSTLSAEEQADVVSDIYGYARTLAKAIFVVSSDEDYRLQKADTNLLEAVVAAQEHGYTAGEYFIMKEKLSQFSGTGAKQKQRDYLESIGVNTTAQADIFGL